MAELGEKEFGHRQLDGVRGAGEGEEEFAGGDSAEGAGEHGAAGDLGPAQHAEKLAETGEGRGEVFLNDGDGLVAGADAGAAVGEDAVDGGVGQALVEEGVEVGGVVGKDAVEGDGVAGGGEELADEGAAFVGGFGAGVAEGDDGAAGGDRFGGLLVGLVGHNFNGLAGVGRVWR